jgi:hypothetical protein
MEILRQLALMPPKRSSTGLKETSLKIAMNMRKKSLRMEAKDNELQTYNYEVDQMAYLHFLQLTNQFYQISISFNEI